jgi:transcriptional regulator with XRE-family HTH domain
VSEESRDKAIGERIQKLRKARDLSQAELAESVERLLGSPFHQQTILKIEKGARSLKYVEAMQFARVLGVPLDDLGAVDGASGELLAMAEVQVERLNSSFHRVAGSAERFQLELLETWELYRATRQAQDSSETRTARELLARELMRAMGNFDDQASIVQQRQVSVREELRNGPTTQ